MGGPIAGKAPVVGGRAGLLREMTDILNFKLIGNQVAGLVPISGKVQRYPDAAQVGNIIIDLPHIFIRGLAFGIPAYDLDFQAVRILGAGSYHGADTGRLEGRFQLGCC